MRIFIAVAAVAGALIIFRSYFGGSPNQGRGGPLALAGTRAASFSVKRLDGTTDALDRYRGHAVVVNLWASWCAPCRDELPALDQIYRENRARGLVVLGIDQGEASSVAATFVRERKVDYPILLDEDQRYGRAYAALGLPTTIFVDPGGRIVRGVDGAMTLAQLRAAVAPLVGGR